MCLLRSRSIASRNVCSGFSVTTERLITSSITMQLLYPKTAARRSEDPLRGLPFPRGEAAADDQITLNEGPRSGLHDSDRIETQNSDDRNVPAPSDGL